MESDGGFGTEPSWLREEVEGSEEGMATPELRLEFLDPLLALEGDGSSRGRRSMSV